MSEIDVNGISVHYREQGSGPALVLVHGLGGSSELWEGIAPGLVDDFRVVTYDLRGAGQSEKPSGPYSLDLLVEDLDGLIEALGLAPATLVGHSMSGGLVLAYAAAHPGKVRAVAGVGAVVSVPDAGREGMRERAAAVRAGGMAEVAETVATNGTDPSWRERDPAAFQAFKDALAANDAEGYAALALVVSELDVSGRLADVRAPVLLVVGESDPVSPPAANESSAALLPDVSYAAIADCGHIIPLERPRELLDALGAFVRERALQAG